MRGGVLSFLAECLVDKVPHDDLPVSNMNRPMTSPSDLETKVLSEDILARLGSLLETALRGRADMGNIQVLDSRTGLLRIHVQRGFENPFLEFFEEVPAGLGSACGMALASGSQVVVENVAAESIFRGDALKVLQDAGVRSVDSTPLVNGGGRILGMLSTHRRTTGRLGLASLVYLRVLAQMAADIIESGDREKGRPG